MSKSAFSVPSQPELAVSSRETGNPAAPGRLIARSCWGLSFLLAIFVALALLLDNAHYVFRTELYENGDMASNSLAVHEAKRFHELHGNYSRWGFHHPGPAFFYVEALGEAVLYDALHVVPTPYNAQILATICVTAFFFCAALAVCCRRTTRGSPWLLPLALLFAVFHFSSVGCQPFLSNWPPWVLVMPFLCLIVAGASVAAGNGEELPLLVLTGGFLVHGHVAQPLFVVPLALLSYSGLVFFTPAAAGRWRRLQGAWQTFPRQHIIALALLALFLFPLALDAASGRESNLALILEHLRTHRGGGKKLLRSLCYFLQFGAYRFYQPELDRFEQYSASGMLAYVTLHWRAYALWAAALFSLPLLWLTGPQEPGEVSASRRRRFPRWLGIFLMLAFGLTLVWGMKQDGDMFYFNAYFNDGIFFALALAAAVVLAEGLARVQARLAPATARTVSLAGLTALWVAVGVTAVSRARAFKSTDFDDASSRTMAASVRQALTLSPNPRQPKMLAFEHDAWESAVAVALELERLGHRVYVTDDWDFIFGKSLGVFRMRSQISDLPLAVWRIVKPTPASAAPSAGLPALPLLQGYGFDLEKRPLDPAGGQITFSKDGNYMNYARYGWSRSDEDWAWSVLPEAALDFRPLPVPDDQEVELVIDAAAFTADGRIASQRVEVGIGKTSLGTVTLLGEGPDQPRRPVTLRIPASIWHADPNGTDLRFHFLDAASPAQFGLGADDRRLGGAFYSLRFHVVPAGARPNR